ncbi:hypothetical protein LXL04_001573 [Taraxacum kok-saghyz]
MSFNWAGDYALAEVYPCLAVLDVDIGCKVADKWSDGGWRWNWRRQVEGGVSAGQVVELGIKLTEERCVEGLDFWYWQIDPDGKFTVAGTRNWIDEKVLPSAMCSTKWCSWVPKKVNIFVWRVLWKRLPTQLALKARGIGVESVLCPTCSDEEETVNHVISSCSVASSIWDLVTRWLQVTRNLGTGSDSLFQWLEGERMTVDKKKLLEAIVWSTMWVLWRFRNDKVHEANLMRKDTLFDFIQDVSFCWFNSRQKKLRISWVDWLQNPFYFM